MVQLATIRPVFAGLEIVAPFIEEPLGSHCNIYLLYQPKEKSPLAIK
jgi:hypothetical protein